MEQPVPLKIATASTLADGRVVYLSSNGHWSRSINDAELVPADCADGLRDRAIRDAKANIVIGVDMIDVTKSADGIVPTLLRERIRAFGPTTPPPSDHRANQKRSGAQ